MVLHDVSNDAKFVEVAASAFGSERLLEGYLHVVNVVTIPSRVQELIAESEDENVFDHFLAKVVINAKDLVFNPIWRKSTLQLS